MINAVSSTKSGPTSLPDKDVSQKTQPTSFTPSQPTADSHHAVNAPHLSHPSLADDLRKKIEAEPELPKLPDSDVDDSETVPSAPDFPPLKSEKPDVVAPAEIRVSNNSSDQKPPSHRPSKRFNPKMLVGALVLVLTLAGGGAAYFLSGQSQDIRQQAASEEVTGTERYTTAAEWQTFNKNWQTFMADTSNTWEDYVTYAKGEGARYNCQANIMTVAKETLYGCDLNALYVLYEPESYIQAQSISPQDSVLNSVLDGLITNSGLLQEAEANGLTTLSSSIFNSSNKDTFARYAELSRIRNLADIEKTVDFEAVAIYFHNQVDPLIPLDQAQQAAEEKMNNLYTRLQNGEITMQQAGEEIKNDSIQGDTTGVSLTQLDALYQENAYVYQEGHIFNSAIFKDPVYDDELRSLGEGQMSTVRLCRDYKYTQAEYDAANQAGVEPNFPMVDSCYIIFKVNKINFGILQPDSTATSAEEFVTDKYTAQTTKEAFN